MTISDETRQKVAEAIYNTRYPAKHPSCLWQIKPWAKFKAFDARVAETIEAEANAAISALLESGEVVSIADCKMEDRLDEYTPLIKAAYSQPLNHDMHSKAFQMVSNRHGKFALVDLVYWLLTQIPESGEVVVRKEKPLHELMREPMTNFNRMVRTTSPLDGAKLTYEEKPTPPKQEK